MAAKKRNSLMSLGVGAVLLVSTGCASLDTEETSTLAVPEEYAVEAVWEAKGNVRSLTALTDGVAYLSEKDEVTSFHLFDSEGNELAEVGSPAELGTVHATTLTKAHDSEGNAVLSIHQEGFFTAGEQEARGIDSRDVYSSAHVFTGFTEDGTQLYRHIFEEANGTTNEVNPATGKIFHPQQTELEDIEIFEHKLVDGVDVFLRGDANTGKTFVAGQGWSHEVPQGVSIKRVGEYAQLSNYITTKVQEGHGLSRDEDYCRFLDPRTGAFLDDGKGAGGVCISDEVIVGNDSLVYQNRSQHPDGVNAVFMPESGDLRTFNTEDSFMPYSVDASTGTVYGVVGGTQPAKTQLAPDAEIELLEGVARVPVLITESGLAAFSLNSMDGKQGPMTFISKK